MEENGVDRQQFAIMHVKRIAERLWHERAAIMVGSGFSKNADPKYPNWNEFADAFWNRLHGHPVQDDGCPGEKSPKEYANILQVMEEVQSALGQDVIEETVRALCDRPGPKDLALHRELLEFPWADVFTTNYDRLLEDAAKDVISHSYGYVYEETDFVTAPKPRIVKVHGSFPSSRPFIVTGKDYREYERTHQGFVNAVRQTLLENTLVLIGYSGEDPDFLQWVDWLTCVVGDHSMPRIYMPHVDRRMTKSREELLRSRHIQPINLYDLPNAGNSPKAAFEAFFKILRDEDPDVINWSRSDDLCVPSNAESLKQFVKVVSRWRSEYPGWLILPVSQRIGLWFKVQKWLSFVPASNDWPEKLSPVQYLDVVLWLYEVLQFPLNGEVAEYLATVVDCAGKDEDVALPRLRLSLARYFREVGDEARWEAQWCALPESPSKHYEKALMLLQDLDYAGLSKHLDAWELSVSDGPIWSLRKAGLILGFGNLQQAKVLVDQARIAVRRECNVAEGSTRLHSMSVESIAILLSQRIAQVEKQDRTTSVPSSGEKMARSDDRVYEHRRFQCDIGDELASLSHKLYIDEYLLRNAGARTKQGFDVGARTQSISGVSGMFPYWHSYSYLRHSEVTGLPYCIGAWNFYDIPKETLVFEALQSVRPQWVMMHKLRARQGSVADVFSRDALARMSSEAADSYAGKIVRALRFVEEYRVQRMKPWFDDAIQILPELLSRLMTKCTFSAKEDVVAWLQFHYQVASKVRCFHDVSVVWRRLWAVLSKDELRRLLPKILQVSAPPGNLGWMDRGVPNPFDLVGCSLFLQGGAQDIADNCLDNDLWRDQLNDLSVRNQKVRGWAFKNIFGLMSLGVLSRERIDEFARIFFKQFRQNSYVDHRFGLEVFELKKQHEGAMARGVWRKQVVDYGLPSLMPVDELGTGNDSFQKALEAEELADNYLRNLINVALQNKGIFTNGDRLSVLEKICDWFKPEFSPGINMGTLRDMRRQTVGLIVRVVADVVLGDPARKISKGMTERMRKGIDRLLQIPDIPVAGLQAVRLTLMPRIGQSDIRLFCESIYDQAMSGRGQEYNDYLNALDILVLYLDNPNEAIKILQRLIHWSRGSLRLRSLAAASSILRRSRSQLPHVLLKEFRMVLSEYDSSTRYEGGEPGLTVDDKVEMRSYAISLAQAYSDYASRFELSIPVVVSAWLKIRDDITEFAEVRTA